MTARLTPVCPARPSRRFARTALLGALLLLSLPATAQTGGPRTDFATGITNPYGLTQLADGTVLVAGNNSNPNTMFQYPVGGGTPTVFGSGGGYGVTQLADGRVLVAEYLSNTLWQYPAGGGTRTTFASGGEPIDATQLADGRLLVSEFGANRISQYPAGGGARTDFATDLNRPIGVVQLFDGRVLVVERNGGAGRISQYPAGGGTRTDFATDILDPYDITQLADGRILVAEHGGGGRVSEFPTTGGTRTDFATGLNSPTDVTQLADGRILVTEFFGNRISQFASPTNALAGAEEIVGETFTDVGSTVGATVEPGEATPSCGGGDTSIWWRYTPVTTGLATIDLAGSDFDTVLSLWTGAGHPLTEVACNDDDGTPQSRLVNVRLTAGTTYYVRVTGAGSATGSVALAFGFVPMLYAVTAPAAGTAALAGTRTTVRWSGPGVPDYMQTVDVYLRAPGGGLTLLGSGANTGKLKVTIPAGTPTGAGYAFRVQLQGDPAVYGLSGDVAVFSPGDQYTFSSPTLGVSWDRGSTHTVTWTRPTNAPAGSTVTVDFVRAAPGGTAGTLISSFPGQPDNGSFSFTVPASQALVDYAFRITNNTNAGFAGLSPAFNVRRFEVTSPTVGTTWTAGSAQTVTWSTGGATTGTLKISLKKVGGGFNQSLGNNVAYSPLTRNVTVPAAAPGGTYVVQLVFTAGTLTYTVNSSEFTITNPLTVPPVVVASRFGSPVAGADARETMLLVRGLTEGAEVGVYAGEYLLATGVVEAGEALVAVPSEIAVGEDEFYFGETAALTLRVIDGTSESAVEARSVTLGSDGSTLDAVQMAVGDVVVIDAAKGGAAGEAVAAFTVAGVSPNPASGAATVRFTSPAAQPVTVVVYDVLGRAVATLFSGEATAGLNEVALSTASLPTGVYVVRVTAGAEHATTRFTVVR